MLQFNPKTAASPTQQGDLLYFVSVICTTMVQTVLLVEPFNMFA